MLTKAAVLHEINAGLSVELVDLEPPRRGEALVRITAAGVCRSDLHFMKGEARIGLPAVLGHEGAGIVEEVGDGVSLVQAGDHVVLSFVPNCGHCYFCQRGQPQLCDTALRVTAGRMLDGTTRLHTLAGRDITNMGKVSCFAEYAVVPEQGCIVVPETLPPASAALIGCCATTGVGAVLFKAKVQPGASVAVIGCGGVGLNVLQGARLAGADPIIAVDIQDTKLDFARRFGATHTVNARLEDAVQTVRDLTDGGADYGFEAFGSAVTSEMAMDMTRKGGTTVIVGLAAMSDRAKVDVHSLVRLEKTLTGTYYGSARPRTDMPRLVEWYQRGKLDLDSLVTRHYKLDDINQAFVDIDTDSPGRGVILF